MVLNIGGQGGHTLILGGQNVFFRFSQSFPKSCKVYFPDIFCISPGWRGEGGFYRGGRILSGGNFSLLERASRRIWHYEQKYLEILRELSTNRSRFAHGWKPCLPWVVLKELWVCTAACRSHLLKKASNLCVLWAVQKMFLFVGYVFYRTNSTPSYAHVWRNPYGFEFG